MGNVFNLWRFGLLTKKHVSENLKTYLISLLVYSGLIIVLFTFNLAVGGRLEDDFQIFVYAFAMYIGLFVFTTGIFKAYHHPRKAIYAQMLPASTFEKFLLAWLLSFVVYFICAHFIFKGVLYLIVEYAISLDINAGKLNVFDNIGDFSTVSMGYIVIISYPLLHAFAIYGSLAFRKRTLILTALVTIAVVAAYVFFNMHFISNLLDIDWKRSSPIPFGPSYIWTPDSRSTLSIENPTYWVLGFCLLIACMLWTASYFKLKEKVV